MTLERDGEALFPDAPTERGVRHLRELIRARRAGFEAFAVFVIQMSGVRSFSPNSAVHPEFVSSLREAREAGVNLLALDCRVTPESLEINGPVDILL